MTPRAVRHDGMRARNLALVLGEIDRRGPVTRAALAELTGLTKTTVSKLTADLLESGLVVESGAVRDGERGRPGVVLRLSGERVAALGLEINVDYLAGCIVDLTRAVRFRRTQAADNRLARPADVVARLSELVHALVDDAREAGLTVVAGMLAVPGPINPASGVVHNAPNLGWRDVDVLSLLDAPVPLRMDNEANLAALGELWFGDDPALGDFLHVSGEIGIGAGLVVSGALFRGAHGLAGELGHMVVSPDGPPCRCGGQGCLEQYAGQDALLRLAGVDSIPALIAAATAGETAALDACEQAGRALGVALTSAVNLLDPDTIVLGGIYAPLFPWVADTVAETLAVRLGQMRANIPEVAVSKVGSDAAVLGAAGQVIREIIEDPAALAVTSPTDRVPR